MFGMKRCMLQMKWDMSEVRSYTVCLRQAKPLSSLHRVNLPKFHEYVGSVPVGSVLKECFHQPEFFSISLDLRPDIGCLSRPRVAEGMNREF